MASGPCVLIFGGTFDPPHRAHGELPPLVARVLGCGRILYVPARLNPLKADAPPTAEHHRLAMLRLALSDVTNAEISTLELDRPGPSYMVDTLEALRESLGPDAKRRLLIGADQAVDFHRWKDWRRIVELAEPAVMLRPPWEEASLRARLAEAHTQEECDRWMGRIVHVPELPVSASDVRDHLRERNRSDLESLLDPKVIAYIEQHGLYGD